VIAESVPIEQAAAEGPATSVGQVSFLDPSQVLDQLGDAVVVADACGHIRLVNDAAARLFGWSAEELVGQPLPVLIPPRFRARHLAGFGHFVTTGQAHLVGGPPIQVAALRRDGTEVAVDLTLGAVGAPGDSGCAVVATLRVVSRRVDLESQAVLSRLLQASVEASRDGVLAVSPQRRILAVNRRFCELWGLPPDSIQVGGPSPALLAESRCQVVDPGAFEAAIRWGHEHPTETQTLDVALTDDRVLEGYAAPIVDDEGVYLGRVWYLHDDTERRAAEAERAALVDQLAAAQRAQRFLLDVSSVLNEVSGFAETLRALATVAVPTLGDLCLIDVLTEHGEVRRMVAVHADPGRRQLVDQLYLYPPDPDSDHPGMQALRDGTSRYAAHLTEEFLRATTRDPEHLRILTELSSTSYMTVPLVTDGQPLGAVTLLSAGSGRRFGPDDLALAEDLGRRVVGVVAKERRYEGERSLSHTLQVSLLPAELPVIPGFELAVRYVPGTVDAEVGGDFWDVTVLPSGEVGFAVGDVAGHDITAASTMAQLRSAYRALGTQSSDSAHLIRLMQAAWDPIGLDRIATAVFARVHPGTGALNMASAGHPPPLIIRDGSASYPSVQPAGPFGAPPRDPLLWQDRWPVGAIVVLFTDGLIEDRHQNIGEGMERLREVAASAPSLQPELLADHILAELSGPQRGDDVALLVVRRTGTS
jgi:PAS domain S-box-containing protein